MTLTVHTLGFLFPKGRPALSDPAEYNSWVNRAYNSKAFHEMLIDEAVPAGLIIQGEQRDQRSAPAVVVRRGRELVVVPLTEVLEAE